MMVVSCLSWTSTLRIWNALSLPPTLALSSSSPEDGLLTHRCARVARVAIPSRAPAADGGTDAMDRATALV
jgi:hypothetical protein